MAHFGNYSYKDAEGKEFTISYVADENGYRTEGDHLPVAPEVSALEAVAAPVIEAKSVTPAATVAALPEAYHVPFFRPATPFTYAAPFGYSFGFNYGYPLNYGYGYNYVL